MKKEDYKDLDLSLFPLNSNGLPLAKGMADQMPLEYYGLPETDIFDELYFEELEHYYDDIDYAA